MNGMNTIKISLYFLTFDFLYPPTIHAMSNSSHKERYFTKLLIGFAALIGCIMLSYYAIVEQAAKKGDWYFWAIVAAFLLCSGVYFCLSAFVHKIKSDFNRRQQQREVQRSSSKVIS